MAGAISISKSTRGFVVIATNFLSNEIDIEVDLHRRFLVCSLPLVPTPTLSAHVHARTSASRALELIGFARKHV